MTTRQDALNLSALMSRQEMERSDLEVFTAACVEALFFTDTGDAEQPAADTELAPGTLADLQADCRSWWRRFGPYVLACRDKMPDAVRRAGHDFWLTRNGHGAGFWDGDWRGTPYADTFTEGAKAYGEFETYAGDDGLIYA